MSSDKIEKLHDTGGINAFIAAKTCRFRALWIAQIDERDRQLILAQLLVSETFDRDFGGAIDQSLQMSCLLSVG